MIDDPYKVLGVTPDTPPDEIKKAYRRLAKQYHPDLHPGDEECARRMNEINSAYDQINNPQKYQQPGYGGPGGADGGGYADPFGAYRAWGEQQRTRQSYDYAAQAPELQRAWQLIQQQAYQSALEALEAVELRRRGARWYYLSALANSGLGNRILALQQIQQAVRMEPGNLEYQVVLQQLQMSGGFYQQQSESYCASGAVGWCASMFLANLFCNACCCGGPGYGGVYYC
jgi:molecular chaperone DnaJ